MKGVWEGDLINQNTSYNYATDVSKPCPLRKNGSRYKQDNSSRMGIYVDSSGRAKHSTEGGESGRLMAQTLLRSKYCWPSYRRGYQIRYWVSCCHRPRLPDAKISLLQVYNV